MAATPSIMLPLGTPAPDFSLPDTITGEIVSLKDLSYNHGFLIMFICNHCKYVKHIHSELIKLCNEYNSKGVAIVAISSNDVVNYPEDAPDLMKEQAIKSNYSFPYLYDESQEIAKAYQAACTPDFFLFDKNKKLVYRGQFDKSRPSLPEIPVNGLDLRNALEALVNNQLISAEQIPSIGCNIKWKE